MTNRFWMFFYSLYAVSGLGYGFFFLEGHGSILGEFGFFLSSFVWFFCNFTLWAIQDVQRDDSPLVRNNF